MWVPSYPCEVRRISVTHLCLFHHVSSKHSLCSLKWKVNDLRVSQIPLLSPFSSDTGSLLPNGVIYKTEVSGLQAQPSFLSYGFSITVPTSIVTAAAFISSQAPGWLSHSCGESDLCSVLGHKLCSYWYHYLFFMGLQVSVLCSLLGSSWTSPLWGL